MRIGDIWETESDYSVGQMHMVKLKSKYTLQEVLDSIAHITYNGLFEPKNDLVKVSGQMNGTFQVDLRSGLTRQSSIAFNASTEMK